VKLGIVGSGQRTEGMPDPGYFRAFAEQADELGYDSLWSTDHISFKNPILEGVVALSAFAGCTRRIQLGTGILLLPLRHPSLVAKQAASLDYLCGGRLVLGVGVGGEGEKDFEAVEVPVAERGARSDEGIRVLKALWAGRPASVDGRFYRFQDVEIAPAPTQIGGPPVVVGGRSEAALRRAGALGDGWLAYMASADRFARDMATVRRHADAAGKDAEALFHGVMLVTHVSEDGERAREAVKHHLGQRYGRQYDDDHIDRYCLVGSPAHIVERLAEYASAGARHVVFNLGGPAEGFLAEAELLHREVVAPFRERASQGDR
jgi:probable F420-dependent oxidoreductase